jgi:hypothetical protein
MIDPTSLTGLTPARKAQLIYAQARAEVNGKLWQLALGDAEGERSTGRDFDTGLTGQAGFNLMSLMALLSGEEREMPGVAESVDDTVRQAQASVLKPEPRWTQISEAALPHANAKYQGVVEAAARRTGLPSSTLAAIVDAESGKLRNGEWNPFSRNPRSSAAGLGQFLSGTWIGEAERPGSFLNSLARQFGWLEQSGKVSANSRHQLLSQRYDARISIEATADYAKHNLERLGRSGIAVGGSPDKLGYTAYLAHHLGVADAKQFLGAGLPEGRARQLLAAQIGSEDAAKRINLSGSAAAAHREWLTGYISRQVKPQRFAAVSTGSKSGA